MRRISVVTTVGVLLIAATSYAAPAKTREVWATGSLGRLDATTKSIVVNQGKHEMTFVLGPDAKLMEGKKVLQQSDLSSDIGRRVKVRYTANGTSKIADRIEIEAAMPMAKTAPAKAPAVKH